MKFPRSLEPSMVMLTSNSVSLPRPGPTETVEGALMLTAPLDSSSAKRKLRRHGVGLMRLLL
jgi:hypothetical protein